MHTSRIVAAVFACSLWGCEKSSTAPPKDAPIARPPMEKRLVVAPVAVREGQKSAGSRHRLLAPGTTVEVWREGRDAPNELRVNGGGFVDARDLYALPLEPIARFVIDPETTLFADAERQSPKRKLKLASPVKVLEPKAWPQIAAVVKDDQVLGFVTRDNLGGAAPTAAGLLERAEQRMRQLDAAGAARLLDGALALAPKHPVASAIRGGMLWSSDWKRSKALLKNAPAPLPMPELPLGAPPKEGPAWVSASVLRLRAAPQDKAKTLRELPIGSEVVLDGAAPEGWTRVRVRHDRVFSTVAEASGDALKLGEGKVVPTDAAAGYASGFVPSAYLTSEAPTWEAITTRLQEAQAAKKYDEALVWAQRASWMAPSEDRARDLVNLALDAKRYDLAGRALVEPLTATREGGRSDVELSFYWGCSADPREAQPLEVDTGVQASGTCIDFVEHRPCDLCSLAEYDGEEGTEASREANAAADAQLAADIQKAQAGWDARLAELRGKHPRGPWLRVRLDSSRLGEGEKLFVAVVKFDPGQVAPGPDELVKVIEVPFSKAEAGMLVETFVPALPDQGVRYEAFIDTDESAVKHRLGIATDDGPGPDESAEPEPPAPVAAPAAATWTRTKDGCDCGC
jgi:hypothetical protein